ncbi:MAG: TonB-dependent receptor [Woeseiaceae bacterium]|nr:TonB-dependent receptor [Woeseiaceae bacterium]
MSRTSLVPALVLLASLPAVHADPIDEIDTIVVTGSRATQQLSEITNSTSVIALEQLEARNPISVADALRSVPGLHVVQASGQGGVAKVFVRGGDQELTMILVDGVRVNDQNDSRGSAFDFSVINLDDIERIEIVRGPQSAVYGSDALSGVINIITKGHAEELSGSLFAEVGADDFVRGAFDVSGPLGRAGGFSVRVATKDDGEPVPGTTFESDSVLARLSLGEPETWRLRLFGSYADSEGTAFPADSGGSDLAVIREVDRRSGTDSRLGLDGSLAIADDWTLNVLATRYVHDASFESPGVAPGVRDGVPPNGADSELDRNNIAVNAVVENGPLTATVGIDYYEEDGTSDGFVEFGPGFRVPAGFDFTRYVSGAFGELHYDPDGGLTLMASLRRDDASGEGGETTAKLGLLYEFDEGTTVLRANWGQGFSLPGFFALASPLVGNPDLVPETSTSYDLGVTRRFGNRGSAATLALFRNRFEDLIDFDATIFLMVNRDRLDADGVELQVDYAASERLRLYAHATWLDLHLRNSDANLAQRPEWRGGVAVSWLPADEWQLEASLLQTGRSFDSSVPTGDTTLDSYTRVDVVVTYHRSDRLHATLGVDNVFDEDYYEAVGFPAPGARARLGLRYRF